MVDAASGPPFITTFVFKCLGPRKLLCDWKLALSYYGTDTPNLENGITYSMVEMQQCLSSTELPVFLAQLEYKKRLPYQSLLFAEGSQYDVVPDKYINLNALMQIITLAKLDLIFTIKHAISVAQYCGQSGFGSLPFAPSPNYRLHGYSEKSSEFYYDIHLPYWVGTMVTRLFDLTKRPPQSNKDSYF